MSDLEDFIEFVSYASERRHRDVGPRKYLRDYSDPYQQYSDKEFHSKYMFTPHCVRHTILPMLEQDLRKPSKRGLPFAPEIMILVSLRYYATGSFQKLSGDMMGVCQQSVSRILAKVSIAIASKMNKVIKFPSNQKEINVVKQKFYRIAHFPNVIGCIGCTHVKIKKPGGDTPNLYKNREGRYSIKIQAVTGPNMEFFDFEAQPGSVDNNCIYNSSVIKQKISNGMDGVQGVILGDSGYDVSSKLLTPFSSPYSHNQVLYNQSHMQTIQTVEKTFGVWKKRFPCLVAGMGLKLDTVVSVISACATLQNIAVMVGDVMTLSNDEVSPNIIDAAPTFENPDSHGCLLRQSVVDQYFTNTSTK